jgi:TolB protein
MIRHIMNCVAGLAGVMALMGAVCLQAQQEESLTIQKWLDRTRPIPIHISGFSGEVDQTLRFDLEVMGCEIVEAEKAVYSVSGSFNGRLQGFLFGKNRQQLLGKAYQGGTPRLQAHAFADDIIERITDFKGIARTRIAFKAATSHGFEVFVADYDGHNAQQLTTDGSNASSPCWWPGHNTLFYGSTKGGFQSIYSHVLSTGYRKLITPYAGSSFSPAVSSNGRVAMILSKGGRPNLYVADADGSNLKQLTFTKDGGESCPCWSPDGQTICYVSTTKGVTALYTIPASGGTPQRLPTIGADRPTEPDWSPDGQTIVFTALGGGFQICTVPATGGTATFLCEGTDPSWAPNSRNVIFVKNQARGSRSLSLLDVYTKRVKDCALSVSNASQPSWGR